MPVPPNPRADAFVTFDTYIPPDKAELRKMGVTAAAVEVITKKETMPDAASSPNLPLYMIVATATVTIPWLIPMLTARNQQGSPRERPMGGNWPGEERPSHFLDSRLLWRPSNHCLDMDLSFHLEKADYPRAPVKLVLGLQLPSGQAVAGGNAFQADIDYPAQPGRLVAGRGVGCFDNFARDFGRQAHHRFTRQLSSGAKRVADAYVLQVEASEGGVEGVIRQKKSCHGLSSRECHGTQ